MPNKWNIFKEGRAGNKKRQRCGLLVFSGLTEFADSRIQKIMRKCDPTPAYLPLSDRRRLTALVEVHWTRRVQVPMPQISRPNLRENRIADSFKEEGCVVST
jgi:hypothetical protein